MLDKPIFKSKRFVSAAVGLVFMILVAYVPQLQPLEKDIAAHLTDVIVALIAGYSLTDIAREVLNKRDS